MLEAPLALSDTLCWPWFDFSVKFLSFPTEAQLHNTHSLIHFSLIHIALVSLLNSLPPSYLQRLTNRTRAHGCCFSDTQSATYLRDYCGKGRLLQIRDKGQIKTGPINKHRDKMTGRWSNYTDNPHVTPTSMLEETLVYTCTCHWVHKHSFIVLNHNILDLQFLAVRCVVHELSGNSTRPHHL